MSWFSDIGKVIWRGYRPLLFRDLLPGTYALSLGQLAVLICVATLVTVFFDCALSKDWYMISGSGVNATIAGWTGFALFLFAFKRSQHYVSVTELLAAAAALGIWLTSILGLFYWFAAPEWEGSDSASTPVTAIVLWGAWMGAVAWQYLATFWTGRKLSQFGSRSFGLRTLAAALLVLLVVPQGSILETRTGNSDPIDAINAWSWIEPASYRMFAQARKDNDPDEDGKARSEQRVDFEELLDQQPQRVAAALEGIAPSGEGAPNTYFVGLASYSYQDVFMREIKATRDLFDARFKTQSRSIVLNNNEDTAQTLPIASLSNLKRVLSGLAQKMNVEKDLLVLYLTSHGGKEVLSVDFATAPLNDIKAQDLAAALDASGIKHRVVIISACHSGSFIPALKNDQTAVLTAAHADKVSFGCSNERDWTYFSDALVNHALRTTHSFEEAFAQAKTLIAEWEAKEKLTASDPQIYLGNSISAKLAEMASEWHNESRKAELDRDGSSGETALRYGAVPEDGAP